MKILYLANLLLLELEEEKGMILMFYQYWKSTNLAIFEVRNRLNRQIRIQTS